MNQTINEKIGAWLLAGGTRGTLASELGMSRQCLNKRITGTAKWKFEEVIKIADLLGVTPNDLAGIN